MLLLFVIFLLAASCAHPTAPAAMPTPPLSPSPVAVARLSPSLSASPTATVWLTPSPTRTLSQTATATPTATPTRRPAPTRTSTPTPTAGPTVTPPTVAGTSPSTEELLPLLANYVTAHGLTADPYLYSIGWLADYAEYEADYTRQDRDLDGDGQAEIVIWAPQAYQDANAFLAVLVHRDGRWQVDAFVWDEYGHYESMIYSQSTRFGKAQLLVDFRGDTGGTGLYHMVWTRFLIRCADGECGEVWQGTMAELGYQGESTWVAFQDISRLTPFGNCLVQEAGGLWVATVFEESCRDNHDRPSVNVQPRTRVTYCWDGRRYTPAGVEQMSPGYVVQQLVHDMAPWSTYPLLPGSRWSYASDGPYPEEVDAFWGHPGLTPVAAAQYGQPGTPEGRTAGVFDPGAKGGCPVRLVVAGQAAQVATVDCTPSFTDVRWQDLNGGGPELLIDTLGRFSRHTLYVLSWDSGTVQQIAEIHGDITAPDLHAVRPVDLDSDGVFEIVADTLPSDLRPYFGPEPVPAMPYRVFRWNGTEYIEEK